MAEWHGSLFFVGGIQQKKRGKRKLGEGQSLVHEDREEPYPFHPFTHTTMHVQKKGEEHKPIQNTPTFNSCPCL